MPDSALKEMGTRAFAENTEFLNPRADKSMAGGRK
jgi:hypothetical protein